MLTAGSVPREIAAEWFPFLAENFPGRRNAIKDFTHLDPDFVFWIYPNGQLHDAKDAHRKNLPRGFEHILKDEPEYGGFLRGRVASNHGRQIIVVYCREDALLADTEKIQQFLEGASRLPIPLQEGVIVVSDNADIYGTLEDLERRLAELQVADIDPLCL